MTKRKQKIIIALCVLVFIIGIGVLLYPIFSSKYAESVRSEIHTEYQEVFESIDTTEIDEARAEAVKFNEQLYNKKIDPLDTENNGYFDLLNLADNGIMAYINIPKINVNLPIYHGTSDDVLKHGSGHMPQSSLPIGGENTHSVISAHTGMSSNPMFSDLELLEIGDTFTIEVLGEVLTYEVYEINTVLPHNIDSIQIQAGRDLCTLITCTPYGLNTHRLLVHGTRIPTPEINTEAPDILESDTSEDVGSVWLTEYYRSVMIGIFIAVGVILAFIVFIYIRNKLSKKKGIENEK